MTADPGVVEGAQIRILQCFECKTMEVMPDYPPDGPPQLDVVLHRLDEKHGGASQQPHYRTVLRIPEAAWNDRSAQKQIVDQAWKNETGFKPSYYDVKDTLKEDAVKCHIEHRRQVPCIDYRDSSKRLRAPTQDERNKLAANLPRAFKGDRDAIKHGAPQTFLCDFCPVQVAVEFAQRKARGEA